MLLETLLLTEFSPGATKAAFATFDATLGGFMYSGRFRALMFNVFVIVSNGLSNVFIVSMHFKHDKSKL